MTLFFKSHQITIYRNRRRPGTNRFTMSATFTAYQADIQPADPERTESVNGRFGAIFTAFVDANVDILEGDQVVITDTGKKFGVKGIARWEGAGLLDHLELILESQDA